MAVIKKKEYNVFITSTIENENKVLRYNIKKKLLATLKINPTYLFDNHSD